MSDNFGTTIPASPAPQAPAGPPTMQHGPQVVMVEKKRNGLATASLVLGIIALVFCWLPFANVISYLLAFIALGLGIPAVLKGRKHKVGMGVAIAGIVLALGSLVAATVVNTATVEAIDDAVATATVSEDEIDVEFGKATVDAAGFTTVEVTVTNTSSQTQDPWITVAAESADGSTQYDTGNVVITDLDAGQSTTQKVIFTEEIPSDATFVVTDVV